MTNECDK